MPNTLIDRPTLKLLNARYDGEISVWQLGICSKVTEVFSLHGPQQCSVGVYRELEDKIWRCLSPYAGSGLDTLHDFRATGKAWNLWPLKKEIIIVAMVRPTAHARSCRRAACHGQYHLP